MKKYAKKCVAMAMLVVLTAGTVGCGKSENDMGPENVKEYYSIKVLEDVPGTPREYYFDTSVFSQKRFDGKLYFEGIEVILPIGSISELHTKGVDIVEEFEDGTPIELLVSKEYVGYGGSIRDDEYFTEWTIGKMQADNTFSGIYADDTFLYNDAEETISVKDAEIGAMRIRIDGITAENDMHDSEHLLAEEADVAEMLGMAGQALNVDTIVEKFGLPIYYYCDSNSQLLMFYYYGDYSLIFHCGYEGEDEDFARPVYSVGDIQYTTRHVERNHGVWIPDEVWQEYLKICKKYD